jgi:hypothetical protein
MLNSALMAQPSGSRIVVDNPDDRTLRVLHWLGYFPERIDGQRQTLIKTLAPGFVMQAPQAEQAAYLSALGVRRQGDRTWPMLSLPMALLTLVAIGLAIAKL